MQPEINRLTAAPNRGKITAQPSDPLGNVAPMDPKKLASLDFGLFRTLCSMGTSRERVCSAMGLSQADYDYIARLL